MIGEFLQVDSSQDTSTNFMPWFSIDTSKETSAEARPLDDILLKIIERVALPITLRKGVICRRLPAEGSAYPFKFKSNIVFKFYGLSLLYQSFKNRSKIIINNEGALQHQDFFDLQKYSIEGPSDDVWTAASWVFDARKECALSEDESLSDIRKELNGLLNNFKQGIPIERPSKLLKAAEQVANQYNNKKQEDIEAWAEKLSQNLSKLSD